MTGSVDQRGNVQAVGGINEKIEGFYAVCKRKGLTGSQGVLIPADNVKHLMLREEIVEAVHDGKFRVYPIETIDQGIEILTGMHAGERQLDGSYPSDTFNHLVDARIANFARIASSYDLPKENVATGIEALTHH